MPILAVTWGRGLLRPVTHVRYSDYPYFLGRSATFHLTVSSDVRGTAVRRVRMRLQCIRETAWAWGLFGVERRCLWAREGIVREELPDRGEARLRLDAELPGNQPGTDFSRRPNVYWELVVECDTRAGRTHAAFLVPIFAESPSATEAPIPGSADVTIPGTVRG